MNKILHFDTIDSTSLYLKKEWMSLDNFTFVYADEQLKGKGRENRTWISNKGENLLCSILIKDRIIIEQFNYVSLLTAVVIVKILRKLKIKNVAVKWPNDVYVNGVKICGILLEGSLPNYLVIGIGLNVNQTTFSNIEATSIKNETLIQFNIDEIAKDLLQKLCKSLSNIDISSLLSDYRKLNYLKNKHVSFIYKKEQKNGVVKTIDKNGFLVVKVGKELLHLSSDEVNLIR